MMREMLNKQIVLQGDFCTLIPIREQDLEAVIKLRNREKNKYFLHQESNLTLEQQKGWYEDYLIRDNDIYWGIWKKNNTFIGTIRIYNIEGDECEEGSCIVDENYAREAPYAVEAKYLLTNYAFETLKLKKMINVIKADNKVMNSFSRQQGYKLMKEIMLGESTYNYYVLECGDFEGEKIEQMLEYWKMR